MGHHQIIQKLESHLRTHSKPSEECHVLYAMAEIRKYLDQVPDPKYLILRFYGSWCVHREMGKPSRFVTQITTVIDNGINQHVSGQGKITKGDNLARFLSLAELKDALEAFFTEKNLPGLAVEITSGENWDAFRLRLFGILSEQLFKEPSNGRFVIVYDKDGSGNGKINFTNISGRQDSIPFVQNDIT